MIIVVIVLAFFIPSVSFSIFGNLLITCSVEAPTGTKNNLTGADIPNCSGLAFLTGRTGSVGKCNPLRVSEHICLWLRLGREPPA